MDTIFAAYGSTIIALGVALIVMLLQLVVVDVVSIMRKHTPGTAVPGDHDDTLFRVTRTVGNTNESVAIFLGGVLFCVLSDASPLYTSYAAWAYTITRTAYAVCYYANLQTMRSLCFGLSMLALTALVVVGFSA